MSELGARGMFMDLMKQRKSLTRRWVGVGIRSTRLDFNILDAKANKGAKGMTFKASNVTVVNKISAPPVSTPPCEEKQNLLIDPQLPPEKALRVVMLKRRFADTISKAQEKLDKAVPARTTQHETKRSRRQQPTEKTKFQDQVEACIAAKAELQRRRQRERGVLNKMEMTIVVEDRLRTIKDLEKLCSGSSGRPYFDLRYGKPLEQLGLHLRPVKEYEGDEPELEDGEIRQ